MKLLISVQEYDSFDEAQSVGKEVFIRSVDGFGFARWDKPLQQASYGDEDPSVEWA